jgi:galactokinase
MTAELCNKAVKAFGARFGRVPQWLAVAPGRVNLIGEHTDYNGGHVLPMAVDRHVVMAAAAAPGSASRVWSELDGKTVDFDLAAPGGRRPEGWARYVAGVGMVLAGEGVRLPGIEAAIVANLPPASGLSSSAALEVASALTFLAAAGQPKRFERPRLARFCQTAEHRYAGVNCGIMDQYSVACAERGRAMYLDCRTMFVQQVPLPAGMTVLLVDSGVPRRLAEGEYNLRREACESAARKMSAEFGRKVQLAEVSHDELARWGRKMLDEREQRFARHVVGEELRSARAVEHLRRGEAEAFGELARESHRSLAEDFAVSCPQLDTLVRLACGIEGVYGARLTGAGFGGAAVVFCSAAAAPGISDELAVAYEAETGIRTRPMPVLPSAGAHLEEAG